MFYYKAFHFIREGKIGFKYIDVFLILFQHKYDLVIIELHNGSMKLITNTEPISNVMHYHFIVEIGRQ